MYEVVRSSLSHSVVLGQEEKEGNIEVGWMGEGWSQATVTNVHRRAWMCQVLSLYLPFISHPQSSPLAQ